MRLVVSIAKRYLNRGLLTERGLKHVVACVAAMKEVLGDSYFNHLANLTDLVLLMDNRTQWYRFRVTLPEEAGYAFGAGASKSLRVRVRGPR